MASVYRNGKYWYISSGGKSFSTGYTTAKFETKRQIEKFIKDLPESDKLKLTFFDKRPEFKNEKVTVVYAISKYEQTINGLGPDGTVIDARKHEIFHRAGRSQHKRLIAEFGDRLLNEVTDSDVLRWMQKLRAEGLKTDSIKRYIYVFSAVFSFGISKYRGWCKDNPVTDKDGVVQIELRKNKEAWEYKGRVVDVVPEQVEALLTASQAISRKFFFFMLLDTQLGTRRREIKTMLRKDVDLERKRFTVEGRNAKTRRMRSVFYGFSPPLIELFEEFTEGKQLNEYIFSEEGTLWSDTRIYKSFMKARKLAKLPETLTFRDLRHFAGEQMEKRTVAVTTIAKQLGTSVKLLEKTYLKKSDRMAEEEMLEKLT